MEARVPSDIQTSFQPLIKTIQSQITELCELQLTHPAPKRFMHAIVSVFSHFSVEDFVFDSDDDNDERNASDLAKREKLKTLTLDPFKLNIDQMDISEFGYYLREYKLKYLPPVESPTPLLHEDKARNLLNNWLALLSIARELNDNHRKEIYKLAMIKELYMLRLFTPDFLNLLWSSPIEYVTNLQHGFYLITEANDGIHRLLDRTDDTEAAFLVRAMCQYPDKADTFVYIYEIINRGYGGGWNIPFVKNIQPILTWPSDHVEALKTRLEMMNVSQSDNEGINQIVFDVILESVKSNPDATMQNILKENVVSQNNEVTFAVKTTDLVEFVQLIDAKEAHFKKTYPMMDIKSDYLNSLRELSVNSTESILLSDQDLYKLVSELTQLEDHSSQFKTQVLEANLLEKMFGKERAQYLKHTWVNNRAYPTAFLSAFVIEPSFLQKFSKLILFRLGSLFIGNSGAARYLTWELDIPCIKILKPFVENDEMHKVTEIAKSLYWLGEYQWLTSERIQQAIENYDSMRLLTNVMFKKGCSDFKGDFSLIAQQLYNNILPLIVKKHQEMLALGVKPESLNINLDHVTRFDDGSILYRLDLSPRRRRKARKEKELAETAHPQALTRTNIIKDFSKGKKLANGCFIRKEETNGEPEYLIYDGTTLKNTLKDKQADYLKEAYLLAPDKLLTLSGYHYGYNEIGYGDDGRYQFKVWDLTTNQCIYHLDGGNKADHVSSCLLTDNQFVCKMNNHFYIHNDNRLLDKFEVKIAGKLVGVTPQGYIVNGENHLSLVCLDHSVRAIKDKMPITDNFILLKDHSIVYFACHREKQTLHDGEGEEFHFPPQTHVYHYRYDTEQNKYVSGEKRLLELAVPRVAYQMGQDVLILEVQNDLYALDFSSPKLTAHLFWNKPANHVMEEFADYKNPRATRNFSYVLNDETLLIDLSNVAITYQIKDLKQFIHTQEKPLTVALSNHANSLWNQTNNPTDEKQFAFEASDSLTLTF